MDDTIASARFGTVADRAGLSSGFEVLFQAAPSPFLVIAPPDYTIIAVNDEYLRATMTERSAIVGRGLFEVFPDNPDAPFDGTRQLRASLERTIAGRRTDDMPITYYPIPRPASQGGGFEDRWWSPRNAPVLGPDGDVVCIIHHVVDVTARVRAEHALRDSEQKFRTVFESIDEGFCIIEVKFDAVGKAVDYVFLEVNPAFEGQTGIANAAGRSMREIAPEHEEHWFEIYGRVAMTGEPVRFQNRASQLGRTYDVHAFRIGEPEARRVAILFDDITTRVSAETASRESEERRRLALEAGAMGSFLWHIVEDRGEPDARALELFGLGPDSRIFGLHHAMQKIHPDDAADYAQAVTQALSPESDGRFHQEARFLRPDGSYRWLAVSGQTFFGGTPPQAVRMYGTVADSTARREIEERQAFLLKLSDALAPLTDAVEIMTTAARMLGDHVRADRTAYGVIRGGIAGGSSTVLAQHVRRGEPLPRDVPAEVRAETWAAELILRGEPVVVSDAANDPRLPEHLRAAWVAARTRALVAVYLLKNGREALAFSARQLEAREWTPLEVHLIREVAERTWAAAERARAEAALRAAVDERDALLKELHHRVKNNLQVITSLLEMQARQTADRQALSSFSEARNRITAIAAIHELLYQSGSFSEVDLAAYARRLVRHVVSLYEDTSRIEATVDSDGITIDLAHAVPLGLLLNELVSNAYKHAFPSRAEGKLRIALLREDGHIRLNVADTGVGLPSGFNDRPAATLGLQLVRMLTKQLGGTVRFESAGGTSVEVCVPVPSQPR